MTICTLLLPFGLPPIVFCLRVFLTNNAFLFTNCLKVHFTTVFVSEILVELVYFHLFSSNMTLNIVNYLLCGKIQTSQLKNTKPRLLNLQSNFYKCQFDFFQSKRLVEKQYIFSHSRYL